MSFKRIAPIELVTWLMLSNEEPNLHGIAAKLENLPEIGIDKEWMTLQNLFADHQKFEVDVNSILFNEDDILFEWLSQYQSYYIKPSDVKLVAACLSRIAQSTWLKIFQELIEKPDGENLLHDEQQESKQAMFVLRSLSTFLSTAAANNEGIIRIDSV